MSKILRSPFDIVAEALEVRADTLTETSCMGEHPNWDSMNHISIIVALENSYEISIPNSEIMKYDNMKAIIELYEKQSKNTKIGSFFQGMKKSLKRTKVGKILFK